MTATARTLVAIISIIGCMQATFAADELPRAIDSRLKIELFAEHPDIVTPTGIDVDHAGRVWAIESNTHFPPAGYKGHPSDRILVMQDTNGDHKADKITVFTDGLKHTMSIAVKPLWLNPRLAATQRGAQIDVFIATRRAIWLYTDNDGDLKADKKKRIITLETKGDYPHDGLAGFAFDAMGWMYFGFGENLGADYKIIGSDGVTLSGGAEGGNIYRCRPDGSKLKQWATGFWNPHASCVDAFGRLFTVDNDPDSRPPCRLLHIIEGGDYGFRYRNGRKGLHPFTAWNGEIPGTLPMVSGTGEAPSGIVAYESDGFPKDYIGNLLVGSWGDHRIDRFRLKPRGASFESLPETIIQGGEDFRPVGLAVAPDGSLFCTDWVKRDYKLHGHGRVWRISMKDEAKREVVDATTITQNTKTDELLKSLESPRLDLRRMAAQQFVVQHPIPPRHYCLLSFCAADLPRARFELISASLRKSDPATRGIGEFHASGDFVPDTTATAIYWFGFKRNYRPSHSNWGTYPGSLLEGFIARPDKTRELMHDQTLPLAMISTLQLDRITDVRKFLNVRDAFAFSAVVKRVSQDLQFKQVDGDGNLVPHFGQYLGSNQNNPPAVRLGILLAAKKRHRNNPMYLAQFLDDPAPSVRRAAVQWVAEENLKDLRPQVEAILDSKSMTTDLFLATLAALEMLDGKDPKDFDKTPAGKYVLPLVKDEKRSPAVRAQALRLVDENDPALDAALMRSFLENENVNLQLEAVRTMQRSTAPFVGTLLAAVAVDEQRPLGMRAEAIAGLAGRSYFPERNAAVIGALDQLRKAKEPLLRLETLRSTRKQLTKTAKGRGTRLALLRSFKAAQANDAKAIQQGGSHRALAEQLALVLAQAGIDMPDILKPVQSDRPKTPAGWYAQLEKGKGDAAAGRRTFFHSQGAGCYRCHTVNGRGEQIGPDLSRIGGAPPFANKKGRKRLAESILEPSKEIAPQFISWTFLMESGKVHTGMILGDTRDNLQRIGTSTGEVISLKTNEIEERHPQQKSLMPDDLHKNLTATEFRDLLAFLESLK